MLLLLLPTDAMVSRACTSWAADPTLETRGGGRNEGPSDPALEREEEEVAGLSRAERVSDGGRMIRRFPDEDDDGNASDLPKMFPSLVPPASGARDDSPANRAVRTRVLVVGLDSRCNCCC